MVADQIERMKRQYTDKYVVVDATRPELARFRDVVGRVKTVNMSGRALVEFDDYHLNIGWFDIAPEFLKVVDKPPPKVEKPVAKKPAAAATTPAEAKPAAKAAPPAKAGKPSVADILAAARAGKAGGAAAAPAAAKPPMAKTQAEKAPVDEQPAVRKVETAPAPAAQSTEKIDKSKMSIADIVAWCRQHDAK